ncbi:TMEM165/GDT1 family protein [Qipengyuania sp. SM2507]
MTASLIFAMVAAFLAGIGARDQLIVARLSGHFGGSPLVLATGLACATLSAAAMAWAGWRVETMISDSAETMLVAFALAAAAFELFWPIRLAPAREPTRSLAALAIVLLSRQFGDGARFCIFAIAAATSSPQMTALGGALGGAAALAMGWVLGHALERKLPLRGIRIALGSVTLIIALVIGLSVRGII